MTLPPTFPLPPPPCAVAPHPPAPTLPLLQVRDCCDQYTHVFVYGVENMRNSKLKEVRGLWRHSRFFYGKNRVMQAALGKSEAEEYKEGLSHVAEVGVARVGVAEVGMGVARVDVARMGVAEVGVAGVGAVEMGVGRVLLVVPHAPSQ